MMNNNNNGWQWYKTNDSRWNPWITGRMLDTLDTRSPGTMTGLCWNPTNKKCMLGTSDDTFWIFMDIYEWWLRLWYSRSLCGIFLHCYIHSIWSDVNIVCGSSQQLQTWFIKPSHSWTLPLAAWPEFTGGITCSNPWFRGWATTHFTVHCTIRWNPNSNRGKNKAKQYP